MAGIYDWILNALKTDQSPATNQLPPPIPSAKLTGLPVPFQSMPSESAAFNPFEKTPSFTGVMSNPTIPQDAGNNIPNDPLRTIMIRRYMNGVANNGPNQTTMAPSMGNSSYGGY